jgi:N-acetylmuramoyl-L-alanine amidase CwlA
MAKFSKKVMGKEVGEAKVYAEPHTMSGKKIGTKEAMMAVSRPPDPNTLTAKQSTPSVKNTARVSMGDPASDNVKTTGIKIRGTGAATKGVMSRGPMA